MNCERCSKLGFDKCHCKSNRELGDHFSDIIERLDQQDLTGNENDLTSLAELLFEMNRQQAARIDALEKQIKGLKGTIRQMDDEIWR